MISEARPKRPDDPPVCQKSTVSSGPQRPWSMRSNRPASARPVYTGSATMPSVSAITMERSKIADRMVNTTVNEAMTPVPITVSPTDDIRDAAQRMVDAFVHRVLVTDEGGQLVGILTALDLAGLVATDL